jgi:hypothetical protein
MRYGQSAGMTLRDYAEQIHENEQTVLQWKYAAEVAVLSGQHCVTLTEYMRHLSLIHSTSQATWSAWVSRLLEADPPA